MFTEEKANQIAQLQIWKSEAGKNRNSEAYFVEHPTYQKLLNDDSIFLVKAQKGTGKTAIRTIIKNRVNNGEISNSTVLDLQFSELFNTNFFSSMLEDELENHRIKDQQHSELIKFTVLVRIFAKIIEFERAGKRGFGRIDSDLKSLITKFISVDLPTKLRKNGELEISWSIAANFGMVQTNVGGKYRPPEETEGFKVNFAQLIGPIEKKLFEILEDGRRYYFLIDKTDDFWKNYGYDYESFIAKFIFCCDEINSKLQENDLGKQAKLIVFVRTDLYNYAFSHIAGNSGKLARDSIVTIDWQESYKNPNSSLMTVANDRLRYGLLQIGEQVDQSKDLLSLLIEFRSSFIHGNEYCTPVTSLFNYTFLHPRDIVALIHSMLQNDSVDKFKTGYGEYIYTEVIKDQLTIKEDSTDTPRKVFDFLKSFLKANSWTLEFFKDDLTFDRLYKEQLMPYFKTKASLIDKLLEVSIIGTIDSSGERHFAYRENSIPRVDIDTRKFIFHYGTYVAIKHYSPDS